MNSCRRLVSTLLLLLPAALFAQESRGWLLGRVTDPSGSAVVQVRVSAVNTDTNTTLTGVTNQDGNYEIPYLIPGPYVITVELAGFNKAVRNNVTIRTADRRVLDFQLQIGNLAESVTVSAEPPPLETATASSGMLLDERRIRELPVVGGNAMYLTRLAPGVTVSGGHSAGNPMDLGGATGVIVNGTRGGNSEASLDGVPNMQGTNAAFSPPQDLVQEFKVQTTNYDASIGRASGAVVNVSMKSGTNALHGTAYLNDSRIRSIPWFSSGFLHDPTTGPITPEKRKQAAPGWLHQRWGATASGPISIPKLYNGRNRSFWTFGYEGVKINRQPTVFETVPTDAQKRGDFSQLLRLGSVYQIYDPMTIQTAPNGRFSRQPLAGNIIPAARISPIAAAIAKFYPDPNVAGTADGRQNFFTVQREPKDYKGFVSRLDHTISEKHRVFGRVNWTDYLTGVQTLPTIAQGTVTTQDNFSAVLDDVYVVSPRLLVNLRAGFTFFGANTYPESRGFDITTLGFQKSLVDQILRLANPTGMAFPVVYVDDDAITQLSSEGGTPANRAYQSYQGTVTNMMGNHSMRFGGDLRIYRESTGAYGNVAPRLEFGKGWTRGPLDTSPVAPIGQGFASMMLGIPTGGRVNVNSSAAEQSAFYALFFQDDWKLSRKLTLNMGLRWELDSGLTERYNRSLRRFLLNDPSPISAQAAANYARSPIPELPVSGFATLGGLSFANVNGEPRSLWNSDRNNFAPRFGFAYQLNPDTVIRSGYGIFFVQSGADRQGVNQGGFNQATNLIPSNNNGLNFVATLANPFPSGIEAAPGASQGMRTFLGRAISFFRDERKIGYQQRWSFSIQRTLPLQSMIDVQYVGNRGTGLEVSTNINALPAQYLSTSPVRDQATIDFLGAQVNSPFAGIAEFAGTGLANVRIARSQLLRPFPHFGDITVNQPAGMSWYHGLQANFQKRMARGFTVQVAYSWSKFMEATAYLNPADRAPEHVISDLDFPQRFTISGIWELPVGKGRTLGSGMNRFADALLGGWQLQAWFEGQSGQALGFGNVPFFSNLHDIVLPVSQRHPTRWFNTDAGFERNAGRGLASNIQTMSSRFTGIRGDGINNLDASLFKNYKIRERLTAQFRFETFNTLNHAQFANPVTNPTNFAFGSVNAEKGHGQRQVTFGAKLIF